MKLLRVVILSFILILVLIVSIFTYKAIARSIIGTYIGLGRDFVLPVTSRIKTNNGRINVLVMGKGGAGHDAPDLTDTMIVASISTISNKMALISIPRDIWIPSLTDKINSAYMYGKQKQANGGGISLAKSIVEEIMGVQIDYGIVLDFNGFKDIIDALHGITIDVKTGFTDTQYPIAGREDDNCNGDKTFACRYETVTFQTGIQNMDGNTALKFVRSRHASGVEGGDIAREARQQLVISAIIKKVVIPQTLTNLTVDKNLLNIAQKNIETDLKPSEEATLARYIFNARGNLKSYNIPDNLLYNPTNQYKYFNNIFTHAFVFIPNNKQSISGNNKDWSDTQNWVQTVLP